MPDASNLQTSFIGGEWSPYAQGRADEKDYRNAMNICLNGYPMEAGAWTRRQGFRFAATTRLGQPGWLLPFAFAQNAPYLIELTNQILRLFAGPLLVSTNDPQAVISVSTANPAVVTTATAHGWSNGATVQFLFAKGTSYPLAAPLMNRQFVISAVTSTTFKISDPITGAGIDGSLLTYVANTAQAVRVLEIATTYTTSQLTSVNKVQTEGTVVLLCPGVAPQSLTATTYPAPSTFGVFSFAATAFTDGPYQDPNKTGTLTPSAKTGSITLSGAPANTFAATDVGRFIRLLSEPANWASGTAYVTGNTIKYADGLYYTAIAGSTGKPPDQNPASWAVNTSAAIWTWATITAYTSGTQVTATISGVDLLYTLPINVFRLGLYSATTGYPTNGVYHEGRLWLAGAQGNRLDASNSNDPFNMAPTAADGTVGDANAISYTFNSEDVNEIFWMMPDNNGIVCGTQGGEWMIAASALNDPLTPASIQAHRRSKYKAANTPAVHAGMSLLFVQAQARKVMEYVADVFSGKFLGRNLNEQSRHLTTSNLQQIAYQQEITPVVWGRTGAGALIGSTYKRESSFVSEPPKMNGWHRHQLGSGRVVESIAVGPSVNGDLETLSVITNDPSSNIRHVELMVDGFDETDGLTDAWFLDDAVTPTAAIENVGGTTVTFYGMEYLAGKTVSVWAGGLDLGDYVVAADGSVVVPINGTSTTFPGLNLFTDAFLTALNASGQDFGGLAVFINRTVNVQYPVPSGITIQTYIPTTITLGGTQQWIDDYGNDFTYVISAGSASNNGIAKFHRFSGVEILEMPSASMFNGAIYAPAFLSDNGFIYYQCDNGNGCRLVQIKASDLTFNGLFGAATSAATINNLNMPRISSGCVLTTANKRYLAYSGVSNNSIGVMDLDRMQWAGHAFPYVEAGKGQFVAGESITSKSRGDYAAAYSINCPGNTTSTPCGVYRTVIQGDISQAYNNPASSTGSEAVLTNAGITTTEIATIAPSAIDAAWTTYSACAGLVYDQIDGNLIFLAATADSVTNKYYAVKINAQTGAIIWQTALGGVWTGDSVVMPKTTLKFGQFSFIQGGSPQHLIVLNSLSGAITSTTSISGITGSVAISNDIDGSILTYGNWNGSGATALGSTPASFSNEVFRLMGFTGFAGQTTATQDATIPVVIGFTYTSQGQMLRGIAPDATGARNGPALGKTRRDHRYAVLLANAQGLSFGTDFAKMNTAILQTPGGTNIPINVLKTGVHTQTLTDRYSYDGMLCWQISRPYPATIASAENFLQTQDR